MIQKDNFYVLTGGSGTGKSSIIAALADRGYCCVEEVGRQIVRQQMECGGDATPWQNHVKLRDLIFEAEVNAFEAMMQKTETIFFDRGLPEPIGYSLQKNIPFPPHFHEIALTYRYNATVFVTPPWADIYKTDNERQYSFAEAVADYESSVGSYLRYGYQLVEVPRLPVQQRADFIITHIE